MIPINKNKKTLKKLQDILDEQKWNDFITTVESRLEDILGKEVEVDLTGLRIEYKRDEQDTVNTSITAKPEERAKKFICPRIPKWVSPDHLTILGVIGMTISAAGFLFGFVNRLWLIAVPIGLFINWFGDSFDGSIARYRKRTRPNYGYYIDKIVDAVALIILTLGVGLSGFVKIEIAFLFCIMYLALMLHVDLIVHVQNKCQYTFGMLGPNEVRLVVSVISIVMLLTPVNYYDIYGYFLTQYDIAVFVMSVIMFVILIISIVKKGIELNKSDTEKW